MFLILQIAGVVAIVGYLAHCRVRLGRRNRQSWAFLVAKLRPAWGGQESSNHYGWQEGISVGPDELWANINGPRGVWTLFKNAGVMLEMAEFAERNCETIDQILLQRLRSDALQIRKSALAVLARLVMKAGSDTVRIDVFQIASMYTGMTARMVQMIELNAGAALNGFVAAM